MSLQTVSNKVDTNTAQLKRLEHIDFCLLFLGKVTRKSHMMHFAISSAAATRDLTLYKGKYPKNISPYNQTDKEYNILPTFHPMHNHDPVDAIKFLSKHVNIDGYAALSGLYESPSQINSPNIKILSVITSAIYQRKAIELEYGSLSSGITKREFVPFALVDNGLRWHVRGYDRKSGEFRDFVINRINQTCIMHEALIEAKEGKEADTQWNRIVEMEIIPHPNLEHKEVVSNEYNMKDGVLRINTRAAIAGYFLLRWNVDCSQDHTGDSTDYHLWLKNHLSLYDVNSSRLVPSYVQIN